MASRPARRPRQPARRARHEPGRPGPRGRGRRRWARYGASSRVACRTAGSCEFTSELLQTLVDVAPSGSLGAVHGLRDFGIRHVGGVAKDDGAALLRRKCADGAPELGIAPADDLLRPRVRAGYGARDLLGVAGRDGAPAARAVVVDCLVVSDGEQPRVEIAGMLQPVVGPKRGDEGLLEDVLGV